MKAVDSLHSEFRAVDSLVAHNTARVLKAFQNAQVGSHVSETVLVFGSRSLRVKTCTNNF